MGAGPARRIAVASANMGGVLHANGFRRDQPLFFVSEAVTQYLTEAAVRRTLAALSRAAADNQLIFTYVRRDFLEPVGRRLTVTDLERFVLAEKLA